MCLAVPGKIVSITSEEPLFRRGKVSFGGVLREINLAYVEEAKCGDYVIVHAGFAIQRLDETAAAETLAALAELGELEELEEMLTAPTGPETGERS